MVVEAGAAMNHQNAWTLPVVNALPKQGTR
jgi:hypothetical protein